MAKAVVAYVPALHRGYVDFFSKYKGEKLYILSRSLVREIPRLERDIRAIGDEEARSAISALNIFEEVGVVDGTTIGEMVGDIVMPDEDVSRSIAENFFKGKNVEFVPTFLRWDRNSALFDKKSVEDDRVVTLENFEKSFLDEAYSEAKKSVDWWRQVGAVITKDGKLLLAGRNKSLQGEQIQNVLGDPRSNFDYGERADLSLFLHAEAGLIARAAKEGISLKDSYIYVTTFPCPGCAKLIVAAGIKKVYYVEGYSILDAEALFKENEIETIRVRYA